MTASTPDQGLSHRGPEEVGALAALVGAVAAVAVAAQVSVPVPGSPVPQSLQTLAVVLVGAWLGPRRGALALALYAVLGGVGAPVFADGAGGVQHLLGPTLGYLAGFVVGAALMGWWVRQAWGWGVVGAFAGAVVVHGVILALGGARLGALIGPVVAWESGVAPFLVGGVAKSAVAAAGWVVIRRRVADADPHRPPEGPDAAHPHETNGGPGR